MCSESSRAGGTRPRAGFGGAGSGRQYIAWPIKSVHTLRDYFDFLNAIDPNGVEDYCHGASVVISTSLRVEGESGKRCGRLVAFRSAFKYTDELSEVRRPVLPDG